VGLTEAERDELRRAVVRRLESAVRITDVPFADEKGSLLAILPETGRHDAWRMLSRLADEIRTATYFVRPQGGSAAKRPVWEHADVRLGFAAFPEDGSAAADLLAASQRPLDDLSTAWPVRDASPSQAVPGPAGDSRPVDQRAPTHG